MNLAQVDFEIGVLEGKLDAMGLNPGEKDCFKLLEESEAATAIRNGISRLERTAADLRWAALEEKQNAWMRANGVDV